MGRTSSLDLHQLLQPGREQQRYIERVVATMPAHELRDAVLLLAECLEPHARSVLMQVIAEIALVVPFRDGQRKR